MSSSFARRVNKAVAPSGSPMAPIKPNDGAEIAGTVGELSRPRRDVRHVALARSPRGPGVATAPRLEMTPPSYIPDTTNRPGPTVPRTLLGVSTGGRPLPAETGVPQITRQGAVGGVLPSTATRVLPARLPTERPAVSGPGVDSVRPGTPFGVAMAQGRGEASGALRGGKGA